MRTETIAKRLLEKRLNEGLTVGQLGAQLGLAGSTIHRFEKLGRGGNKTVHAAKRWLNGAVSAAPVLAHTTRADPKLAAVKALLLITTMTPEERITHALLVLG